MVYESVSVLHYTYIACLIFSKKNWARYDRKRKLVFLAKHPLSLPDFIETWIFSTVFRNILINIKFHENPSSGSRATSWGRKDRHDETDSRLSPKNTRQISSITTDALINSVHNPLHSTDMTGDTAIFPSKILSLRLCKSAERVRNTPLSSSPINKK
jgi:hypothetical protein